jgi:hypothetical protein
MGPLTVVFGIILGSGAAIVLGLLVVLLNFWLLGDEYPWINGEVRPLLAAVGLFMLLTTAAAFSFYGSLRKRPWTSAAALTLLGTLTMVGVFYWPR